MDRNKIVNAVLDLDESIIKDIAEMIIDFTYGRELFFSLSKSHIIFPAERVIVIYGSDNFRKLIKDSTFSIYCENYGGFILHIKLPSYTRRNVTTGYVRRYSCDSYIIYQECFTCYSTRGMIELC